MFPSPSSRATALFALLTLAGVGARAEPRLGVSGSTQVVGSTLELTLEVRNLGDAPAVPLSVEAELLGRRDETRDEAGVAPGALRRLLLRFPLELPRPGLHAVRLRLGYAQREQRAYLLLALGENPAPALRVEVPELSLDTTGQLQVLLESADGRPHRARLEVLAPRGLRVQQPAEEVAVPASGRVAARLRVFRGAAPRGSEQGIVVIAGVTDGELERTSVATGLVRLDPDPALLPRLRGVLVGLALLLLLGAVVVELRRRPAARA